MAALIPDKRLVENVFFPIKTQQAISGTSVATCQLMEPHTAVLTLVFVSKPTSDRLFPNASFFLSIIFASGMFEAKMFHLPSVTCPHERLMCSFVFVQLRKIEEVLSQAGYGQHSSENGAVVVVAQR